MNDFVIKYKDKEASNRHRGRHFQISFVPESFTYRIRDLGVGFGAFVRVDQPLILKANHLVSMGSSFLVFTFSEEQKQSTTFTTPLMVSDDSSGRKPCNKTFSQEYEGQTCYALDEVRTYKTLTLNSTSPELFVKVMGGLNSGET